MFAAVTLHGSQSGCSPPQSGDAIRDGKSRAGISGSEKNAVEPERDSRQLGAGIPLEEEAWLVTWNPSGDSLVYVVANNVLEWPSGRRLSIPAAECPWDESDGPWPMGIRAKWNRDGTMLGLVHANNNVVIIDVKQFRVESVHRGFTSVFWRDGVRYLVPTVDGMKFRSTDHVEAVGLNGKRIRLGPRGFMITDVSEDGAVSLARVRGDFKNAQFRFRNKAVISLSNVKPGYSKVRMLSPRPEPTLEFTHADFIAWNQDVRAAAAVVAGDTGGGMGGGTSRLYVVWNNSARLVEPARESLLYADSPPEWRGPHLYLLAAQLNDATDFRQVFVRYDLHSGELEELIDFGHTAENGWVAALSVSRDGQRVAYAVEESGNWVLRIREIEKGAQVSQRSYE